MISIILPVLNEQDVIPELYNRIVQSIKKVDMPYELIFAGNGSIDKTLDVLLELGRKDSNVKVIKFTRNFGHQAAIMAGFDYAVGDVIITMDADLQHPPEIIPELIKKWREGYDIVYTKRSAMADRSVIKNLSSRFFYYMINRLSEVDTPAGAADFRLLDKKVVKDLQKLKERTVFLRGIVSWLGYKHIGITYTADPRHSGESKYNFFRMLRFAVDGITSFSSIPLYFSAFIGIIISVLSFIYAAIAIYYWIVAEKRIPGWTSVIVIVLFLGGIQLITMGIQGAYMGRIYKEVKDRPRYLVEKTYGFK